MEKRCFKCLETKPIAEFYRHLKMADGHLGKCKVCTRRDVTEHRRVSDNPREYDRVRAKTAKRKEHAKRIMKAWTLKHPGRTATHKKVRRAVLAGKIVKTPCQVCGSEFYVHGHHEDYSKPLDVIWLCARCHALVTADDKRRMEEHRAMSEASGRSRSIIRCDACLYWSGMCGNERSHCHGRRTSANAHCFEFDFKMAHPRNDGGRVRHAHDREALRPEGSGRLERTGGER